MIRKPDRSTPTVWAHFRFSVVGALLSSPPPRGTLKAALRSLADKLWTHPVTGREVQFSAVTIERWYYTARGEQDDPVRVLQRAVRKDCGQVFLAPVLAEQLRRQPAARDAEVLQEAVCCCPVTGGGSEIRLIG